MGEQNLEFTLNTKHQSIGKSDFTSPTKIMSNSELEEQLEKIHLQESPQFSSIKKQS